MAGKPDLIAFPAMHDEGAEPVADGGADVGSEVAPGVAAAKGCVALDDQNPEFGSKGLEPQRNEAVGGGGAGSGVRLQC